MKKFAVPTETIKTHSGTFRLKNRKEYGKSITEKKFPSENSLLNYMLFIIGETAIESVSLEYSPSKISILLFFTSFSGKFLVSSSLFPRWAVR